MLNQDQAVLRALDNLFVDGELAIPCLAVAEPPEVENSQGRGPLT